MGLMPVPPGDLATVVTALEMTERPRPRPMPDSRLRLVRWPTPDTTRYRQLFRRVGEPWLWYSRLVMDDDRLAAILSDDRVAVFAVNDPAGIEVGMLELDHRRAGECEIGYFALVPELVGKGHGRWLMANALARAWRPGVTRVWVHSCTLDHPRAVGFYQAMGFVAYRRTVETFADPRLTGIIAPDAAPQVALLCDSSRR